MGIQGLLPLLKSTTAPVHIKEYAGMVAAVDTYSWLHKGAISCSKELCHGLPTSRFVDYCMRRVDLLRQHGVKPLLVFDGGRLPMKEDQENKRSRSRKLNLEKALEHERSGNIAAAYDCYQKAVDVTPQMAFELVKVLQQEQVAYIVAPYEADAQLAFLSIQGHADVVITEDSDSIPFGCRKVLFKMDKFGQGVEFRYDDLPNNRDLNFTNFTKQMILEMCILSGCDYLPSLPGMGLKRAHGLIRRFGNYRKVIKHIQYNGVTVPSTYEEMFTRAILTFQHHWVYDPIIADIVHLTPLPSGFTLNIEFLGSTISREHGQAIARGEIDPISGVPFECEQSSGPPTAANPSTGRKRQLDLPIQKNLLTNYFLSPSTEAKRQFKSPRNVGNLIQSGNHMTCDKVRDVVLGSMIITQPRVDFPLLESPGNGAATARKYRSFDFSVSVEEEDQVLKFLDSKLTILQNCGESPISDPEERVSVPGIIKVPLGEDHNDDRKKQSLHKSDPGKCMVRSVYFSKKEVDDISMKVLDTGRPMGTSGDYISTRSPKTARNATLNVDVELSKDLGKHSTPIVNAAMDASNWQRPAQQKIGKSFHHISAGQRKHVPMFNSKLLGKGLLVGKFASDTSHIEQYAAIARESMERFVSTIAPFRCSAAGARASGLRRPVKSCTREKANRSSSKFEPADGLSKFAFVPTNCRSSLHQGEAVPGVKDGQSPDDSVLP